MFVIDRARGGTDACPEENVEIAGTTGNIYTVNISQVPSCTCPHAKKGNQCKHIIYVLIRVLKAPEHLQYQLAFISSELQEIFSKAPPIPSEESGEKDGKRKPIEGDCPICCEDFEPGSEEIVYCKAACGNNVHKACFEQWAATKGNRNVTCPYCRSPWAGDEEMVKNITKAGTKNADGYVNVASQLGLSGERDYSTYHSFWVRQEARRGNIDSSWRGFGREFYYDD
ncbi:putative ring finger domain protein [Neofusicoccum parvum UCRNP2]|uniref:Putative ring finger domain protein n=1 Tax=Botryosphaeria parva (strain UCR-NP2) TaxID=1287680 RepID=R1ET48_BOTPV|nr:putative ring finger domain protein [Neofusicoccum parvum UCRNP2]